MSNKQNKENTIRRVDKKFIETIIALPIDNQILVKGIIIGMKLQKYENEKK